MTTKYWIVVNAKGWGPEAYGPYDSRKIAEKEEKRMLWERWDGDDLSVEITATVARLETKEKWIRPEPKEEN